MELLLEFDPVEDKMQEHKAFFDKILVDLFDLWSIFVTTQQSK